jgi:DNA invertase Pin-like site-specific DNA recombinase
MANAKSTGNAPSVLVPAVAYVRMSDDRQEQSPDQQRNEITKLAEKGGYQIVRWYIDEGISGDATEKRTAFLKMRDHCQQGDFRAVLCWDQDRFGRFDPIEGGYWIKPFRDADIKLVTVAQGVIDWSDFQGRLVWFVQQEGKHAFLRDLSRNLLRGHLDAARRGEWQGGPAPYGYILEPIPDAAPRRNGTRPKRLTPHPDQAPVVRRIFALYDAGKSLREITDILNREGVPSSTGGKWRFETVRRRLIDETYLGTFVWNVDPTGKYNHVAKGDIVSGRADGSGKDVIRIPGTHEPLVSVELFERTQRRLATQRRNTSPFRTAENPYLLSGVCRCGHCGGTLVGQRDVRTPTAKKFYECSTYRIKGGSACKRYSIPETVVLRCLVQKLQEHFGSAAAAEELRHEIRRRCQPSSPMCDGADVAKLQARIEELSKQIDTGAENLLAAPASLTAVLTTKLQSWQKERDELQAQLQAHQRPQEATVADVDQMVDAIASELQTLQESLNEADHGMLRQVLRQLVSKVEFWFDGTKKERRFRSIPRRGLIHLRPDLKIFKLVTGVTSPG